jgi:hypothetical protein
VNYKSENKKIDREQKACFFVNRLDWGVIALSAKELIISDKSCQILFFEVVFMIVTRILALCGRFSKISMINTLHKPLISDHNEEMLKPPHVSLCSAAI